MVKWLLPAAMVFSTLAIFMAANLSNGQSLLVVIAIAASPLLLLFFKPTTRNNTLVLLLVLVPFSGILKGITGSRYGALVFDLGILAALVFHFVLTKQYRRLGRIDILLGLFLLLALLQMFNPNVPSLQAGIEGFRKFAFMGIAFFAGRHIIHGSVLNKLRNWLLVSSVVIALYGIKQFFFMSALDWRVVELASADLVTYTMGGHIRSFSTLPGPFHLGLYLLCSMLLLACLLMDQQFRRWRWWLIAAFAVELAALLLTRTKSNWFGLFSGIMLLAWMQGGGFLRKAFRLLSMTIVAGLTIYLLLLIVPAAYSSVLYDAFNAFTNVSQAPTFQLRQELWHDTIIPAILAHPFLSYGTSSAGSGLADLYHGDPSAQFFDSHALYFKILLEMGTPGLVLFAWIVGAGLIRGFRLRRFARGYAAQSVPMIEWSLSVVFAFLVAGLASIPIDTYPANYYFWLLLGLLSQTQRTAFGNPS